MKYLIVRIEEAKGKMKINVDNCSREDATENEEMFADAFEQILKEATDMCKEQAVKEVKNGL